MARAKSSRSGPGGKSTLQVTSIDEWLTAQSQQDLLRFITCGSVDDGKSTLIGRLLWESQQVLDDQLTALRADSKRHGTQGSDIDFALLVDGLAAEREQGITIDVAYRFFATPSRRFIVADTPGHEQYTRNMVTGASTADVAVLLVDATQGLMTQTRRHAWLASLVGIRHVVLAVNKMDLIRYNEARFREICAAFDKLVAELQFQSATAIPMSALQGHNVTNRLKHTPWYTGPTLMEYLDTVDVQRQTPGKLAFPIQWVNRPNPAFRGYSGTLTSGALKVGDTVRVTGSGQTAQVKQLITMGEELNSVDAGTAITLVLDREVDASRGDVMALADQPLEMTDQFEATLLWLHDELGLHGRSYEMKLANQWVGATITTLKYRIDVNTQAHEICRQLTMNDIAVCNLALSKQVVFERYEDNHALGGFILVDRYTSKTVAAGMIRHNLRRAQNVHRQVLNVTRADRERVNGHPGKVIWFTGLSGSGKSTLANALEQQLHAEGKRTYILDGDNVRQGLNKDLGFTDADRVENIRRVAEVAKLMMDAGLIVITAFISPFRAEREMARQLIGAENFIEVYVDTSLAVCETRDPKGLYRKARSGQLPNMTGINSPYEAPEAAALTVDTHTLQIEQAIAQMARVINS